MRNLQVKNVVFECFDRRSELLVANRHVVTGMRSRELKISGIGNLREVHGGLNILDGLAHELPWSKSRARTS
jgi:hypothetical protein